MECTCPGFSQKQLDIMRLQVQYMEPRQRHASASKSGLGLDLGLSWHRSCDGVEVRVSSS